MGKYDPLSHFLNDAVGNRVVLRFDELDSILGGLPGSARRHTAWWTNNPATQPQSGSWVNAGWTASEDLAGEQVVFTRTIHTSGYGETPARQARVAALPAHLPVPHPLVRYPEDDSLPGVVLQFALCWEYAGIVRYVEKLGFPKLPSEPGIYAFVLVDALGHIAQAYVGQALNLRKRANGYRNAPPNGPGQQTNRRVNAEMIGHLGGRNTIHVHYATQVSLGSAPSMGMKSKSLRIMAESAAIFELEGRGYPMLNR